MTPEQIAKEIQHARDIKGLNPREAFLALADLTVSMLRMIDARRESGICFEHSYNEEILRIAVEPLAAQEFPPGPPMRPPADHLRLSQEVKC
jgi:hypothetical protein